jgi:hypothetical protein
LLLSNRNRLTDCERSYALVCGGVSNHLILLVLPSLFSDMDKRMETWGMQGKIDPFKSIYDVCGLCTYPFRKNLILYK